MRRGGLRRISPGSDADLAKRKAAESAALKLGWNKLEERIGESCSLISIKIAVSGRRGYCCPIILDNSATVGSLPFGVNPLITPGRTCDSCLLRSSSERPVN
jgi:hypothetical protein